MTGLLVTATQNYSTANFVNIVRIRFTNPDLTATFTAAQFDDVQIMTNVLWDGLNTGADRVIINGGSIDASAWQFVDWQDGIDGITFNGTSADDTYTGTAMLDIFNGRGGKDVFYASGGNGDVFNGGIGNDTFHYGTAGVIADTINGGNGASDKLRLEGAGTYDLSGAAITGVERLYFGVADETVVLGDAQIGGLTGFATVNGTAAANSFEIRDATALDMSAVTFNVWNNATDSIHIYGTMGNDLITGSAMADVIHGSDGTDAMNGHDGDDVFEMDASIRGSIDGGGGSDTLHVSGLTGSIVSFTGGGVSNVERIVIDAVEARVLASAFGPQGITEVEGTAGSETLFVQGGSVDLSTVTFLSWDDDDNISMFGTTGDDTIIGTDFSELGASFGGGIDLIMLGGGSDTFILGEELGAGSFLDGGTDYDIFFVSTTTPTVNDLTSSEFVGIEELVVTSSGKTVQLRNDQIGGTSGFIVINGDGDTIVVEFLGGTLDLTDIQFRNWLPESTIRMIGSGADDMMTGSDQNDIIEGSVGIDTLDGAAGLDTLSYAASQTGVTVGLNTGNASGGDADGDIIAGFEHLIGSAFDDVFTGESGNNTINGGAGLDTLTGGNGTDTLTGGEGADIFNYSGLSHSRVGVLADVITDFSQAVGAADRIKVSPIDAQAGSVGTTEAFTFINQAAFTAEGQIRAIQQGNDTLIQFNSTGTDTADMEIILQNFTATTLTAADFIL